jgi:hypothetical protein
MAPLTMVHASTIFSMQYDVTSKAQFSNLGSEMRQTLLLVLPFREIIDRMRNPSMGLFWKEHGATFLGMGCRGKVTIFVTFFK